MAGHRPFCRLAREGGYPSPYFRPVGRAALIVQPAPWTVDRAQVNVGAVACAADLLYGDLPVTRRLVTDIDAVGYAWIDSDDDGFY